MTTEHVLLGAVVLAAATIQGVIGFAFGLVLMGVLPRLVPLGEAVAITATCGVFVAALIFWRYRRHVLWGEVVPQLAGAAIGLPVGVLALKHVDPDPCVRALGVLILLYLAWTLWPRSTGTTTRRRRIARPWGFPAGIVAGAFGGAFATGGPPVIAYGTARGYNPKTFKAVLQGFFVTATAAHLGLLANAGILTRDVLLRAVVFVPLVPLGTWLGGRYGDRLHPIVFRRLVLAALFVLGLDYLVNGR
ncbi:MAG: sulfite exporter TauE/SafE family protein [Planctomycetota bacterium]|nr:sulfite exporter TauE/SafE family protein [Planctomycetota bacterium]